MSQTSTCRDHSNAQSSLNTLWHDHGLTLRDILALGTCSGDVLCSSVFSETSTAVVQLLDLFSTPFRRGLIHLAPLARFIHPAMRGV